MEHTWMYQEICEQPQIAQKVLAYYLPKAEGYYEILKKKKRLILTGIGASLCACKMAAFGFYQYSPLFPLVLQSDELPYVLPSLTQEDLVIFVSQSGESYETRKYASMLQKNGVDFWGITNNPDSFLASCAKEVLLLHCGKEVSSATKTNLISLLLLLIIAGGHCSTLKERFEEIPGKLRETLKLSRDWVEKVSQELLPDGQLYLLGMGALEQAAAQGALMMQEKTWIHTTGTSVSDYRHGTVEVTEKGLPIIIMAAEKDFAEARKHGDFLKNIQARVFYLTDSGNTCEQGAAVSRSSEECFASLYFLPPLQLLAEKVAKKKGLDVDGFRYLSKVVGTYEEEEK